MLLGKKAEEEEMTVTEKVKFFMIAHWRGVIIVVTPILLIGMLAPFPPAKSQWAAYTLLLMAIYWVTEVIPLAVTSFFPVVIFPLADVTDTRTVCKYYMNDSIMMFLGSLILAYSVEQSGLHKRLAYFCVRLIGYSHIKLCLAVCCVTMFVSMWVQNTAATTMMVPINFALLKVFEDQKVIVMYEYHADGSKSASDITAAYFCSASYSATIGGIGTLVGTGTNLVFKGLFASAYPEAPEYLSFPKFSAFSIPLMILLEICAYFNLMIVFFGMFRPGSQSAIGALIPPAAKTAAKASIDSDVAKRGKITLWEGFVCFLFASAMILFFCRSPQMFKGWGDLINDYYGVTDPKFIRDSALAMLVAFIMFVFPQELVFFKNCTARFFEQLPKTRAYSCLDWKLLNSQMPFAFSFLLGGGFALSNAARTSGLNAKLGEKMQGLKNLDNMNVLLIVIIVVILVTNFASNIAVCNVFTPIAMQLAKEINQNPLWYAVASGFSASFCFMIPVGTPSNLIVQSAASIPTQKMVKSGFALTILTILLTWLFVYFWGPVIWPDLYLLPDWIQ